MNSLISYRAKKKKQMVERDVLHVNNTDEDLSASDLSLHFKSLRLVLIP